MADKKFWLGILLMALVFGMTVVGVEAQSNRGGEFTFTNIPGKYDGKYVTLEAKEEDDGPAEFVVTGGDSMESLKRFQIKDGKVIIPLYITTDGKEFEKYSGNYSLDVFINIYDSSVSDDSSYLERVRFFYASPRNRLFTGNCRVNFTNGNATKSYNDRNKPKN